MSATIGDTAVPVYRFEWTDGSQRTTQSLPQEDGIKTDAVEVLASHGREDPECTVTLVGFE